jgi:hypothetical protein
MKWLKGYIAVIILIIAAYVYAEYRRPPVVDWSMTLSRYDRIPFGTYILHDQLKNLFKTGSEDLRVPLYDHLNDRADTGELCIIIAPGIKTTRTDEAELLRHISLGNTVFMATETLSKSLEDTLGVSLRAFRIKDLARDSVSLRLVNPAFGKKTNYRMLKNTVDGGFENFDTTKTTVVGMNSDGMANYIRIDLGRGHLFLHAAPLAFSNCFMLTDSNHRYVSQALSRLPSAPKALYWDDYYSLGRGGPVTPLRVILTKPALRMAYFTGLATILLFILFQSKRRQRIIPVIQPNRNTTMDFVETVGQLYISRADHRDIALKKVTYFLDSVRQRYGLHTGVLDDAFALQLAGKSGVSPEKTVELLNVINRIRSSATVVEPELMQLSRTIDEFQKTSAI